MVGHKKNRFRNPLAWLGLGVLSLIVVGCGDSGSATPSASAETGGAKPSEGGAKKEYTVGFSQIGAESGWRTAETKSVQEEAEKRGVHLKFSDGQGKQPNQIQALRSFITQKVDVIFLAPVVETGWDPVLREAKAANIPVVLLDRGVKVSDDSLWKTELTSDFVEEGRRAGKWLATAMNGKGNVVELVGTVGSSPANDRHAGFMEVMKDSPGIKITHSQTGDFTLVKGKEVMEAFLKSDPNIQAVYAHNDEMALGAIQAIAEAGKQPGKDIIVVSVDAERQGLEAVRDGKINCSVECNPLLGPSAFDTAELILAGKDVPKRILSKEEVFDSKNVAAALPNRKY